MSTRLTGTSDVWSQWCPVAMPGGWLISALFARRLQQLALPLWPLDAAQGMDSRVVSFRDASGAQAWRWMVAHTAIERSGRRQRLLQHGASPWTRRCEHSSGVPAPQWQCHYLLRPSVEPDGALVLTSPTAGYGSDGVRSGCR